MAAGGSDSPPLWQALRAATLHHRPFLPPPSLPPPPVVTPPDRATSMSAPGLGSSRTGTSGPMLSPLAASPGLSSSSSATSRSSLSSTSPPPTPSPSSLPTPPRIASASAASSSRAASSSSPSRDPRTSASDTYPAGPSPSPSLATSTFSTSPSTKPSPPSPLAMAPSYSSTSALAPSNCLTVNDITHPSADSAEIEFIITNLIMDILVLYEGSLLDLFCEGHSIIVEGFVKPLAALDAPRPAANGPTMSDKAKSGEWFFKATEVLAKHDEKYMPMEVAEVLERNQKKIEAEAEDLAFEKGS